MIGLSPQSAVIGIPPNVIIGQVRKHYWTMLGIFVLDVYNHDCLILISTVVPFSNFSVLSLVKRKMSCLLIGYSLFLDDTLHRISKKIRLICGLTKDHEQVFISTIQNKNSNLRGLHFL